MPVRVAESPRTCSHRNGRVRSGARCMADVSIPRRARHRRLLLRCPDSAASAAFLSITPAALHVAAGLAGVIGMRSSRSRFSRSSWTSLLPSACSRSSGCTGGPVRRAQRRALRRSDDAPVLSAEFLNMRRSRLLGRGVPVDKVRTRRRGDYWRHWRSPEARRHRMAWVVLPAGRFCVRTACGHGGSATAARDRGRRGGRLGATWFAAAEWGDRFSADMQRFPEFRYWQSGGKMGGRRPAWRRRAIWIAPRGRWRDSASGVAIATALWTLMFTLNPG